MDSGRTERNQGYGVAVTMNVLNRAELGPLVAPYIINDLMTANDPTRKFGTLDIMSGI
jgi:hypothetical protein